MLAILGGIVGKFIAVFIDEWRERRYIKSSLCDELEEISSIIGKLNETYNTAGRLMPIYLEQLRANMDAYETFRRRLQLIHKKDRRNTITTFYRDLKNIITENENKFGTLSTTGRSTEQDSIDTKFKELKGRAERLKSDLISRFFGLL